MVSKSWKVYTTQRLLLSVIREIISLRLAIPRSSIPSLVLIVARKNVKNGKNN
jgi:hypothetical protein